MIFQVEPNFDKTDSESLFNYINSGGWATENKVTKNFENAISNYVGMEYAIAVPNGTIALYLAVLALNLKKGSRIAVPNLTMVATVNAIIWAGHIPVIIDTDENLCLSLESLMKQENISAVMFVPLNGKSGNGIEIKKYCNDSGIYIIEDSAHALGSSYSNFNKCGSLGDLSIFSYTPHKIITTGQGGMILTNNFEMYEFIVQMKTFNRTRDKSDFHEGFGLNFKFTDIQASIGMSQFSKLNNLIEAKKKNQKYYSETIKSKNFELLNFNDFEIPWFHTIRLIDCNIDDLIFYLLENGIESRMFYPPLSTQKYLDEFGILDLDSSLSTFKKYLWLPSSTKLTADQINFISTTLNNF